MSASRSQWDDCGSIATGKQGIGMVRKFCAPYLAGGKWRDIPRHEGEVWIIPPALVASRWSESGCRYHITCKAWSWRGVMVWCKWAKQSRPQHAACRLHCMHDADAETQKKFNMVSPRPTTKVIKQVGTTQTTLCIAVLFVLYLCRFGICRFRILYFVGIWDL